MHQNSIVRVVSEAAGRSLAEGEQGGLVSMRLVFILISLTITIEKLIVQSLHKKLTEEVWTSYWYRLFYHALVSL